MAGILTRLQMVNEVLDNIAKASTAPTKSGSTLSALVIRYLDRAHEKIARKEDFLFCIATASTVANQKDYSLPSNIRSLYSVRLENGLQSIKLQIIMPWEFDKLVAKPDELSTGQPYYYIPYKTTNTFELFPLPDATYTMRLRFSYWPAAMSSDSQTSDYTHMDDVLIKYATAQLYAYLGEYADMNAWNKMGDEALLLSANGEKESFPDWAPKARGFEAQGELYLGDYYNNPFVTRNP